MSKLLIENLATALGMQPTELDRFMLRKFSFLISCTLIANGISEEDDLNENDANDLLIKLAAGLKNGEFAELDSDNAEYIPSNIYNTIVDKIFKCFGIPDSNMDLWFKLYNSIPKIKREITGNGIKHTLTLNYEQAVEINEATIDLIVMNSGNKLKNLYQNLSTTLAQKYKNTLKIKNFTLSHHFLKRNIQDPQMVDIKQAGYLLIQHAKDFNELTAQDATTLFNYYVLILDTIEKLTAKYGLKPKSSELQSLYKNMTLVSKKVASQVINDYVARLEASLRKFDIHHIDGLNLEVNDQEALRLKLLSSLLLTSKQWKVVEDYSPEIPIDRVILVDKIDLTDEETKHNINLILNKHPKENIVLAFDAAEVKRIDQRNTHLGNHPFTLQVHGHGLHHQGTDIVLIENKSDFLKEFFRNQNSIRPNALYILPNGEYLTRRSNPGQLFIAFLTSGEFGDPDLDLTLLSTQTISDPNFRKSLLSITSKRGHTTKHDGSFVNSNLGPFRGAATQTGKMVAQLVNQCNNIMHVRLTSCSSGALKEDATLENMTEKYRSEDIPDRERRRVLTFIHPDNFAGEADDPFLPNTAAVHCWNHMAKNKALTMTVSPAILSAYSVIGQLQPYMMSGFSEIASHRGIKEIQVKTENITKPKSFVG